MGKETTIERDSRGIPKSHPASKIGLGQASLAGLIGLKERLVTEQETGFRAEIVKLEETNSHTFYKSSEYDNRAGIAVTFKRDGGKEFTEFYHYPSEDGTITGTVLGRFIERYGDVPTKGMHVDIVPDGGLWRTDVKANRR